MKNLLLCGVAAVALSSSAALAADLPVKARSMVVPVPVHNWTGCYLGVAGGGIWSRNDDNFQPAGTVANDRITSNGGIFGGTWGCNYQFAQNWVIGYEGDFSWTGLRGSRPSATAPFQHEVRQPWLMTNRARLGYAWDNWMGYVTGGLATARVKAIDTNATTGATASDAQILSGWTIGGGAEYAFLGNWSAKAEYLYVALPTRTFLNPNPLGSAFDVNGMREHIFRVGLNYKFF